MGHVLKYMKLYSRTYAYLHNLANSNTLKAE